MVNMVKYGQSDGNPNKWQKTQFQVHCQRKSIEPKTKLVIKKTIEECGKVALKRH